MHFGIVQDIWDVESENQRKGRGGIEVVWDGSIKQKLMDKVLKRLPVNRLLVNTLV